MFAAKTIGNARRERASSDFCAAESPVVPRLPPCRGARTSDVRHRALGRVKVDQHVGAASRGVDVAADEHTGRAAETLAGVAPDRRRAGDVERRGKLQVGGLERRSISACPIRPPAPAIARRVTA
jgi:hypothetical protein